MADIKKVQIFGVKIANEENSRIIDELLKNKDQSVVTTINMPVIRHLKRNQKFYKALWESQVVLLDGIGVKMVSFLVNKKIKYRITAAEFFLEFSKEANKRGETYFFLGTTDVVLDTIRKKVNQDFPGIKVMGVHAPPFGNWSKKENDKILKKINQLKVDVLWVGMSAPKQEIWVWENKDRLKVRVIASIGAVFDFYAGTKKRAPKWMQKVGLEWVFRTIKEPLRVGRRYVLGMPAFMGGIMSELFSPKK